MLKSGQPWLQLPQSSEVQDSERREQEKKQDLSCGLQENRLGPLQKFAWKNSLGHSSGEKRDPRDRIGIQSNLIESQKWFILISGKLNMDQEVCCFP